MINRTILPVALLLLAAAAGTRAERIAVLSDIHVTPGNACDSMLRMAVDEINATDAIRAVVVDGDLTNEGSDEQLVNVKSILDGIGKPLYVLPGNHENNWSQSATKTFVDLWGDDRFVGETDSLILVGINCGPYMKMGDGHVKQEDLLWLDRTLRERVAASGKRVVSFNHYPLNADMDNYREYIRVLEKYPVVAHVNGHLHSWKQYRGGGIDGVMVRALDMRKGTYGYTLLDIDADSVRVSDKVIGEKPVRKYAWAANTAIEPLADDVVTEYRDYVTPEGFHVTKIVADSASIFTRVGIGDGAIYYGTSLGDVKAVSGSGELLWSTPTGASLFARPVPYAAKNIVYVPSATKELFTLDASTGAVLYREPAPGPYVADGVISDGALYLGGYKLMEKRDAATGKLEWRYDSLANYCQAAPAISGNDIVFGAWDTNLYCIDTRTGERRWYWNNGKPVNLYSPGNCVPWASADEVIFVAPDRFMTSLDRNGCQRWRSNAHRFRESFGHSADGSRVYAKTMDGELVAVATGQPEYTELWTVDMGIGYDHAPCIVAESNGLVYCGSRRGIVTIVDPVKRKVVASYKLGVSEVNGIDVDPATGLVYVSLIEGTIWQIADLRSLPTEPVPAVVGR